MAFGDSGRVLALNPPAEGLLGRASAEVEGRPIGVLFPTLDHSSAVPNAILRLDACRPNGATFPVRLALAQAQGLERRVWLGRLEREPSEARPVGSSSVDDPLREEFLVTLSHELRSPLQAILSWAQLLRSTPPGEPLSIRGLEAIERNIRWQVEVIDEVLELSRIVSGDLRLDPQPVRWSEVVEESVSEISERARLQGIRLTRSLEAGERPVLADRRWLGRVVATLLANSLRFTSPGGTIDLDLRRRGPYQQLTIADASPEGSGETPRSPDDFRQGNPAATTRFDGLGVALFKVQRLVQGMGGEVQAESAGSGGGVRLVVSLPTMNDE